MDQANWRYIYYLLVASTSLAITAGLAIYTWRRRRVAGATPLMILLLAKIAWELAFLMEVLSQSLSTKLIWYRLQLPGLLIAPIAWLALIMIYTGKGIRAPRNLLSLASLIPAITFILMLTNDWHGLIWRSAELVMDRNLALLQPEFGSWFWLQIAYTYLILLICAGMLILFYNRSGGLYRNQALALLSISLTPLIFNAAYIWEMNPTTVLNLYPVGTIAIDLIFLWALVRYRLLEIAPIARDLMVEQMCDGMLVFSQDGRLLDMNPASEWIFSVKLNESLGKPLDQVVPGEIAGQLLVSQAQTPPTCLSISTPGGIRHYDLHVSILPARPALDGKMILLRDVTERIVMENLLHRRDAIFTAISFAATRFLRNTGWEADLQGMLERLGQATEVSRVYILEKHKNPEGEYRLSLRHEWAAAGVTPQAFNPLLQVATFNQAGLGSWEISLKQGILMQGRQGDLPAADQELLRQRGILSLLVVPILIGSDCWGFICYDDCRTPRLWASIELEALQLAANTLAAAIQRQHSSQALRRARNELEDRVNERTQELALANVKLQQDLILRQQAERQAAERLREVNALHNATAALLTTLDLDTLLSQILDAANNAIDSAEKGMLYLIARDTGNLEMRALLGYNDSRIQKFHNHGGVGFIAKAVRERKPLLIMDARADESLSYKGEITEVRAIMSAIVAPLVLEGKVIGVLSLDSSVPAAFTESNLHTLVSFAAVAAAAIRNAQLHAEVQTQAITDSLTGLYNRRGFYELGQREIESTRRFNRTLAAIMLDVDDFKQINDRYGHSAGDLVLQSLAMRLSHNLRKVDLLGRYGGDEFTILMPEVDLFSVTQAADRLRQLVSEKPVLTPQGPLQISISMGVSRATATTPSLEALLEQADRALYQAKSAGRDRVEIYHQS